MGGPTTIPEGPIYGGGPGGAIYVEGPDGTPGCMIEGVPDRKPGRLTEPKEGIGEPAPENRDPNPLPTAEPNAAPAAVAKGAAAALRAPVADGLTGVTLAVDEALVAGRIVLRSILSTSVHPWVVLSRNHISIHCGLTTMYLSSASWVT